MSSDVETAAGDEAERVREALAVSLRTVRTGRREVERTLGWSEGSIGRLLQGTVELEVEAVLAILGVIGVSPAEFFSLALPLHRIDWARLFPRGKIVPPAEPGAGERNIEVVRDLLREPERSVAPGAHRPPTRRR